ncbi:MAG: hypothetical protein ACOC0P_06565, partial [Planctomycetota bacterium]
MASSSHEPPTACHHHDDGDAAPGISWDRIVDQIHHAAIILDRRGIILQHNLTCVDLLATLYGWPSSQRLVLRAQSIAEILSDWPLDVRAIMQNTEASFTHGVCVQTEHYLGDPNAGLQRISLLIEPLWDDSTDRSDRRNEESSPYDTIQRSGKDPALNHVPWRKPEDIIAVKVAIRTLMPASQPRTPAALAAAPAPSQVDADSTRSPGAHPQSSAEPQNAGMMNALGDVHRTLAAAGVGLWHYDFSTDTATWSPRGLEILGSPKEIPDSFPKLLALAASPDQARLDAARREHLQSTKPAPIDVSFRIAVDRGKQYRWVTLRGNVSKWDTGSDGQPIPAASSGVILDVTEQRWAEQERNEQLRRLRTQHRQLADLFDDAPFFVVTTRGPE